MRLALPLQLCVRYFSSTLSQLALVSWIAVAGLALSIAVLVVVLSVVNGFERELQTRLFAVLPHTTVVGRGPIPDSPSQREELMQLPRVVGVAPVVQGSALAAVPDSIRGVQVTGIDPDNYGAVSRLGDYVQADASSGSTAGLHQLQAGGFAVLLGATVAAELNLTQGSTFTLVLPQASVSLVGVIPRQKRMRVSGIIQTGSELDSRALYMHLADAQRLFRTGNRIQGYQLRLDDLFAAQDVAIQAVQLLGKTGNRLGQFRSVTWMRTHGNLHQAILMQKQTMFLLLAFLVGVAAFNLVSSLLMVVNQRSGDVAILRTMGASTSMFVITFSLLALALGGIGLGLGLALGAVLSSLLPDLFTWANGLTSGNLMSEYFVSYLPVEIRASDLLGISWVTLLLALVSAIYPAWRASKTQPAQVLAHE